MTACAYCGGHRNCTRNPAEACSCDPADIEQEEYMESLIDVEPVPEVVRS